MIREFFHLIRLILYHMDIIITITNQIHPSYYCGNYRNLIILRALCFHFLYYFFNEVSIWILDFSELFLIETTFNRITLIIYKHICHRMGIFYFAYVEYFRRLVGCITFFKNLLVLADSYFFPDFKLYFSRSINAQFLKNISQQAGLVLRRDVFWFHSNCTVFSVIIVKQQIIQNIRRLIRSSQTELFPHSTVKFYTEIVLNRNSNMGPSVVMMENYCLVSGRIFRAFFGYCSLQMD